MFDIGGGELILIVLVIILLFGPKKIPEIAQMFGKGMQQVRKAQSQFQSQINDIKREIDVKLEPDERSVTRQKPVRNIETNDSLAGTVSDLPGEDMTDRVPPAGEVSDIGTNSDQSKEPKNETGEHRVS